VHCYIPVISRKLIPAGDGGRPLFPTIEDDPLGAAGCAGVGCWPVDLANEPATDRTVNSSLARNGVHHNLQSAMRISSADP